MLGVGTLAFSTASASAAAMLPLSPVGYGEANAASDSIVQVDSKKYNNNRKWNKRYGKRCDYYNDNCRHRYRGHYYETPWWTLPVIIGGGIAANNYYNNGYDDYDDYDNYDGYDGGGMSSRHVQWCLNRYQSYNPRNNTWLAYSGRVKQCNSPYL